MNDAKDDIIHVRVSRNERSTLTHLAGEEDLTVPDFFRKSVNRYCDDNILSLVHKGKTEIHK